MIRRYETENSLFIVDPEAKTVTRIHNGGNPHWADNTRVPYEFMQHRPGGGLYFHATDPSTGRLRPFVTSKVLETVG